MTIRVEGISKRFGGFTALDGVDLDVEHGELLALLGPSGSGKTTLLRILAGLEFPDSGTIALDGEDATERTPADRRVGFVFQHYALFRHMTVLENIAFGLRVRPRRVRPDDATIRARVDELLQLVRLGGLAGRYPGQLSGGQRQRVALARAIAVEPRVLLLDEPFGALDAGVRKELRRWLRGLHQEINVTSVFVTHDQEEALELADRVVILNKGRIEQIGTPEAIYEHPASEFVWSFLGDVNRVPLDVARGWLELPQDGSHGALAYVRPHDLEIAQIGEAAAAGSPRVTLIRRTGPALRVEATHPAMDQPIVIDLTHRDADLRLATGVAVQLRARRTALFGA